LQRAVAAPALEQHGGAGMDADGIGRQQVDLDLELARVAHFDQGVAGADRAFALARDFQHAPGHGRAHRHQAAGAGRRRVHQRGARRVQLMLRTGGVNCAVCSRARLRSALPAARSRSAMVA
jgi:hypothetical protein